MPHDPGVDDELQRWATERAPSLRDRAEAEAVAMLRDALVEEAMRLRRPAIRRGRERQPPTRRGPASASKAQTMQKQGELVWAYCVLRSSDPVPAGMAGVERDHDVRAVHGPGLTALVSSVSRAAFGTEPLRVNLNDMAWLERVARKHEGVLDATLQMSTIVPLRMCTLYETDANVCEMLEREHEALADALARLENRWEWGVKVLVDEDRLVRAAEMASETSVSPDGSLDAGLSDGEAYLRNRRRERHVHEAADTLAAEVSQLIHARLQDWALDAVTHPPQNRELSQHEGSMLLNAAYLVDRARVDELRELVTELERHHAELGVRIELTGPWPPYNFVSTGSSGAIA